MNGPRERAVAFVVARLTSSRLPGKQLREIGGISILQRSLTELAACTELEQVVIATVDEPGNRPLRDLAAQRGWELFWYAGDVDDVVGRLRQAAEAYDAALPVLVSGDCPLPHAPSVDALVRALRAAPAAGFVRVMPNAAGEVALLEGVMVARLWAWRQADAESDSTALRAHFFPVMYRAPQRFAALDSVLDGAVHGPRHRMSVDTWADLEFMQTLHAHLAAAGRPFVLPEVVRLLRARPALRDINRHVHQRRLVETLHEVLLVVDAGGDFGYGHFMRCRELAGQVVERLSWPVTFLLDDARAVRMALDCGFRVAWGALGRAARGGPPPDAAVDPGCDLARFGMALVDITARRSLPPGWRSALGDGQPVVVVDRADAMAAEADLVVFPGVAGRRHAEGVELPPLVAGLDHAIVRREVRRHQGIHVTRDIDLLVYLYDVRHKAVLQEAARRRGWRMAVPDGFDDDFAGLLARSRVFVSGYGQSFYEALALGSVPVAWPLSPAHRSDAVAFYAACGLPATLIERAADAEEVVAGVLSQAHRHLPVLDDGTPAIVQRLAELRAAWQPA